MAGKDDSNNIVDRIWSIFSSITLAVVVFGIIALTSIFGTIIEQEAEPARNVKLLAKFFGESFAPTAYSIFDALGFTNMYHSWWFLTLLFIFAANLVICSLDRLPKIWNVVKEPIKPLSPDLLKAMPVKRDATVKATADKAREMIGSAMKGIGFKGAIHEEAGAIQFYAEKARYSRLGVYVTHFSILVILLGAVIGIFAGFNASLNLPEGVTSPVAYLRTGKQIPLGFEIKCLDFDVSFYENTDTPKGFKSWLAIMENGQPVKINGKEITEIDVNSPLKYKGITFYQSSYGYNPTKDSIFRFSVASNNGQRQDINLKYGEAFTIPGTNVTAKIIDFSPALGQDESGKFFTYAEMMNNPAVMLEFAENGKPKYTQWSLKRYPHTWKTPDGIVEFKDLWGAQYTGLQVRRDPGVWIVYLGCLIMAIGLYAAFFMSHTRIWVMLREEKNTTKVTVAGSANKNKIAFEQKIDKLISSLSQ